MSPPESRASAEDEPFVSVDVEVESLDEPLSFGAEDEAFDDDEMPLVILMEEYGLDHFEDADDLERSRRELQRLGRTAAGLDREIESELELAHGLDLTVRHTGNLIAGVLLLGLPLLLWIGWPYYSSSLVARPFHHLHELLRPSGLIGLPLGVLSLVIMIASLAYLVRKKLVRFFGATSTAKWLRFHVVTGLLGSTLALFHASFLPTSAVGLLAMVSVGVVLLSGIIGRYISAFVPKDLEGDEPALDEIRRRLVVYKRKLVKLGISSAQIGIDATLGARKRAPGVCLSLYRVLVGDRAHRREYQQLRTTVLEKAGELEGETKTIMVLVHRMCREHQWLVRYREMKRLVRAWRFLHRWLAIVLGAAVLFHVATVLMPGSTSGWGGH